MNTCALSYVEEVTWGFPIVAQGKRTQLVSMRTQVRSLALLSGLRIPRCCGCGVGRRLQLLIQPQAWELPYAATAALKRPKRRKEKNYLHQQKNAEMSPIPSPGSEVMTLSRLLYHSRVPSQRLFVVTGMCTHVYIFTCW